MARLLTASAAVLALALSFGAAAQDKKSVSKKLAENDKVLVIENTYAPGATSEMSRSSMRVVRVLKGGTLERTYADGKKQKVSYKTGSVHINEPGPQYTNKNVGATPVVLYVVRLK
jgi:hypothetical protein